MNTIKNIDSDILVIIHRIWIEGKRKRGGLDKVLDYFIQEKNLKILLIEHPLYNQGESRVSLMSDKGIRNIQKANIRSKKAWISWLKEVRFNLKVIRRLKNKKIFFATDPLCALPSILYKTKFSKQYFHCVDYSDKRFNNIVLDLIYRLLLKIILKKSDLIGVVSLKTRDRFLSLGCPKQKIYHIPNSPCFKKVDLNQKEENSILCMGGDVHPKYRYEDIVKIARILKKQIPDLKFYISGGKQQYSKYRKKIKSQIKKYGLEKNFVFTGFLAPEELDQYLTRAKIGISFYSQKVAFYMQYGDPLKIREYALYGIPIIADGSTALDPEIEKNNLGFIVLNNQEAAKKISKLFRDKILYQQISLRAVLWAQKNDKTKILNNLHKKLYAP